MAMVSLITYAMYAHDKKQAVQGKWRVPEKSLHLLELLGAPPHWQPIPLRSIGCQCGGPMPRASFYRQIFTPPAAIAHLHYLSELKPRTLDIPDETLQRVFKDHGVIALPGTMLDGRTRKKVKLDYYIADQTPIAFQIIRRKGRILGTMEQWGWRWNDLRVAHPTLRAAMIYDPQHQEIDPDSRAIGEEVCSLFCSYEETDRIHAFLGEVH